MKDNSNNGSRHATSNEEKVHISNDDYNNVKNKNIVKKYEHKG